MELVKDFVNNQLTLYLLPTVLVIVVVILVFTFGFKSAEQPPFDKLTNDDRKQAGKKKKIKEKKATANGHVTTGDTKNEKSPAKESKKSPAKEVTEIQKQKEKKVENNKQTEKNKKNEAIKSKVIEEVKNKKNIKKLQNEKPVDFDEGDWETVPSKADKKKKADQSPAKKDKKSKKTEKPAELEKLVKEVVNKELREKEKEVKVEKPVDEPVPAEEPVVIIEEKKEKEKKKEKKAKKETEKLDKLVEKEVPVQKDPPKPKVENIIQDEIREEAPKPPIKEGGVAFDELGDVWTEAKVPKKSKKKARRDN